MSFMALCKACGKNTERYERSKRCIVCSNKQSAKYRAKNKARCLELTRAWRAINREVDTQNKRDWAANNPEKVRAHHAKWNAKRREANAAKRASLQNYKIAAE